MTPDLALLLINIPLMALLAMHARTDANRDKAIHKLRKRVARGEVKIARLKERLKLRAPA